MSSSSASPDAKSHQRLSLYFPTVAGVVFRSEIAVLVATQTLFLLLNPLTYALMFIAMAAPATRSRVFALAIPCAAFAAIYSLLLHKEWHFVAYVVPPLIAVTSVGAAWLWVRRAKSAAYRLLSLAALGSVLASLLARSALLAVSSLSYPGGEAAARLCEIAANDKDTVRVYADNLVC